jgi:hypothetical protein
VFRVSLSNLRVCFCVRVSGSASSNCIDFNTSQNPGSKGSGCQDDREQIGETWKSSKHIEKEVALPFAHVQSRIIVSSICICFIEYNLLTVEIFFFPHILSPVETSFLSLLLGHLGRIVWECIPTDD